MTTGEKIAALRREHKLSQEALGEKLGLSRQAVSKWEADAAVPELELPTDGALRLLLED